MIRSTAAPIRPGKNSNEIPYFALKNFITATAGFPVITVDTDVTVPSFFPSATTLSQAASWAPTDDTSPMASTKPAAAQTVEIILIGLLPSQLESAAAN